MTAQVSSNRSRFRSRNVGYSLVEILVVIAAIGILAGLGVFSLTGLLQTSKVETAKVNLEHINQAVRRYNHAVKELTNATNSGTTDEQAVFTELQIDGTVDARPGSPYLETNLRVRESSDTTTYRASWNGYEFQLIEAGTGGTGLDLMKLQ